MNFIIWLIVGGVIGWLASMLMKTNDQQGMFRDSLSNPTRLGARQMPGRRLARR